VGAVTVNVVTGRPALFVTFQANTWRVPADRRAPRPGMTSTNPAADARLPLRQPDMSEVSDTSDP
jgi:hypothetical protein